MTVPYCTVPYIPTTVIQHRKNAISYANFYFVPQIT